MAPYIDERWLESIGFTRVQHNDYELDIEPDNGRAAPVTVKLIDVHGDGRWVVNFLQMGATNDRVDHVAMNNRRYTRRDELTALLDGLGIFCQPIED